MNVLSLQPFFGGSHRSFSDGLIRHSRHQWTVLSLPDRHWKWRMRHAPLEFAKEIRKLQLQGQRWDAIFCTDMLDVATLKGLADLPPVPITVYFHENQFTYPSRPHPERAAAPAESDRHFAFTNFTTLMAADQVWFNSQFNLDTTLSGAKKLLNRFPDYRPVDQLELIRAKASVQTPGVEACEPFSRGTKGQGTPPVITWAARWEHDKRPDQLAAFLKSLVKHGINFRVNVIGQSYRKQPEAFAQIKHAFAEHIDAWGYQTPERYQEVLNKTDVILSTADHEFFGISIVEAIARGALPLLPNRLAYPEVVGALCGTDAEKFLYKDIPDAIAKLQSLKKTPVENRQQLAKRCREVFGWKVRAAAMDEALPQEAV